MNAILSGALLPYCIALLFIRDSKYKWWVFAFFMLYSVSFVEKAFFLKAVIPVFYLLCQGIFRSRLQPSVVAAGSVLLLFAFVTLSQVNAGWLAGGGDFWSPTYQAGNTLDQLAWRTFSVPVFSAVDAIKLWEMAFNYPSAAQPTLSCRLCLACRGSSLSGSCSPLNGVRTPPGRVQPTRSI